MGPAYHCVRSVQTGVNEMLAVKDVCAMLRISRSTVERMVKEGLLPPPLKFGAARNATVRWHRETIEAALFAMPRGKK
jgi:excisionase family DNA binding protein